MKMLACLRKDVSCNIDERAFTISAYSGTRNEGLVVAEFQYEDDRLGWQAEERERSIHGWEMLGTKISGKYLYAYRAQSPAVQSCYALDHNEPQHR